MPAPNPAWPAAAPAIAPMDAALAAA